MGYGTYLPYLKIAFRKGSLNGVADLLSRFPLFERYVSSETDCTDLPEDLFEKVGEAEFEGRNMPLDRYMNFMTPRTQWFALRSGKLRKLFYVPGR